MDLIVTGVVAGVLGTLVMDSLNHLFARTGMLSKIDMVMIGRMSSGWARGRFRYEHPSEIAQPDFGSASLHQNRLSQSLFARCVGICYVNPNVAKAGGLQSQGV